MDTVSAHDQPRSSLSPSNAGDASNTQPHERPNLSVERETLSTLEKPASTHSGLRIPSKSEITARHVSLQSLVDSIASEEAHHKELGRAPPLPPIDHTRWSALSMQALLNSNPDLEQHQNGYGTRSTTPHVSKQPSKIIEMSTTREFLFVAVCAVSHLMTQAALGQALIPIDIIARSLGNPSPGELSWFIAGYSLTVGTFIMISGQLGDIFGHKRVFVFGYAWLGMLSCFTGFSAHVGSQIYFDICRALQGIGPALLMPNALALFGRAYAPGSLRKNIVFSIFGALAPAGFVIGGTFGSLFAELVWWPWGFWSYGAAAFGLAAFSLLAIPKALSERPVTKPKFDAAGSLLVVAGLVLVNVAFNNGPLYRWGTPHVYFTLIIGLMCLGGFIWVERRAANPLLPIHALNSTVGFVLALVGLGWGSFGVWVFYTVRFLQHIRGETPLTISAHFSPAVIAGLVAAGLTGALLTHTPVSFVMMLSMIAFFAGIVVSSFQPEHQMYWIQTFVSIVVMPFGMDMSFPAATVILSNHMPPEHQGLAASLVNTVVNYSISIALGIAGTVEVYAAGSDDPLRSNRNAHYTAMGLAGTGVVFGVLFFVMMMVKEGWKVMGH